MEGAFGMPSDEALMDAYARGDGAAFDELFARYEGRAFRFLRRRTQSDAQAADLYQELFLRLHRARGSYQAGRPFAPWFFQIARRLVIDELRRGATRGREVPLLEETAAATGVESAPERRLAAEDEAHGILGRLSPLESYVLIAAKVDGRSYAELSSELGKSVVAIKKLASRAMQRLRAAGSPAAALPAAQELRCAG